MKGFPSYWYYWYTGRRGVAVTSMAVSCLLMTLFMGYFAGFSFWGILLAILLDALGLVVALIYALALRGLIPSLMLPQADDWVLYQFVLPALIAFFLNRLATYVVARISGIGH